MQFGLLAATPGGQLLGDQFAACLRKCLMLRGQGVQLARPARK